MRIIRSRRIKACARKGAESCLPKVIAIVDRIAVPGHGDGQSLHTYRNYFLGNYLLRHYCGGRNTLGKRYGILVLILLCTRLETASLEGPIPRIFSGTYLRMIRIIPTFAPIVVHHHSSLSSSACLYSYSASCPGASDLPSNKSRP